MGFQSFRQQKNHVNLFVNDVIRTTQPRHFSTMAEVFLATLYLDRTKSSTSQTFSVGSKYTIVQSENTI